MFDEILNNENKYFSKPLSFLKRIEVVNLFGVYSYSIDFSCDGIDILIGPNGIGKTTLLSIFNCVYKPTLQKKDWDLLCKMPFDNICYEVDCLGEILTIEITASKNKEIVIKYMFANNYHNNYELLRQRDCPNQTIMPIQNSHIMSSYYLPANRTINKESEEFFGSLVDLLFEKSSLSNLLISDDIKNTLQLAFSTGKMVANDISKIINDAYSKIDNCFSKKIVDIDVSVFDLDLFEIEHFMDYFLDEPEINRFLFDILKMKYELQIGPIKDALKIFNTFSSSAKKRNDFSGQELLIVVLKLFEFKRYYDTVSFVNYLLSQEIIACLDKPDFNKFNDESEILDSRFKILHNYVSGGPWFKDNRQVKFKLNHRTKTSGTLKKSINNLIKASKLFRHFENMNNSFGRYKLLVREGAVEISRNGNSFSIANLSSGELNLFLLFYNLYFNVDSNTTVGEKPIVIIDEPEISLHLEMQKEYLSKLMLIQKDVGCSIVLITHSPFIANGYEDYLIAPKFKK